MSAEISPYLPLRTRSVGIAFEFVDRRPYLPKSLAKPKLLLAFDRVLRQRNGADNKYGENGKSNDQFKKREAERPGITNCRSQFVDSKKLHALITKLKFHSEGLSLGS